MRTYRAVLEAGNERVCVDVIVRADHVAPLGALGRDVRAWIDIGCGYAGVWVDKGTARTEYSVAIPTKRRADHATQWLKHPFHHALSERS